MAEKLPPSLRLSYKLRLMSMTPDELRSIAEELGWSQSDVAYHARRDKTRVRRMFAGRSDHPVDPELESWLRNLHHMHTDLMLQEPDYREYVRVRREVTELRRQLAEMQPKLLQLPNYPEFLGHMQKGAPQKRS